jgi:hypothetical protein
MVYGNGAGLVEKATVKELEKHFTIEIDYKVQNFASATCGKVNGNTFPLTCGKIKIKVKILLRRLPQKSKWGAQLKIFI